MFCDEASVQKALQWHSEAEALLYGTPFSISAIPVVIHDSQNMSAEIER